MISARVPERASDTLQYTRTRRSALLRRRDAEEALVLLAYVAMFILPSCRPSLAISRRVVSRSSRSDAPQGRTVEEAKSGILNYWFMKNRLVAALGYFVY
jgi:hypothetical protein